MRPPRSRTEPRLGQIVSSVMFAGLLGGGIDAAVKASGGEPGTQFSNGSPTGRTEEPEERPRARPSPVATR